jgi:DNA polymerase-3 subunit gamma/tau
MTIAKTTLPLHVKYRPKTIIDLVGQPIIKECLTRALLQRTIAPAYLFAGPKGTGKTSTARILAKSINCLTNPISLNPCGQCKNCTSIDKSTSFDVIEIDAASNGGVDDARKLTQETIRTLPINAAYKVVIIDECHMLTQAAQNALLKSIEEPPEFVMFILCTTELHKVLPTIKSRCLTFEFRQVGIKPISTYLTTTADQENIKIKPDGIRAIAENANGSLRDALQLLTQAAIQSHEPDERSVNMLIGNLASSQLTHLVDMILNKDVVGLIQVTQTLLENGKSPTSIHNQLLRHYRNMLVERCQGKLKLPLSTIEQGLMALREMELHMTGSNNQLWLETMLLKMMPNGQEVEQLSKHEITNKQIEQLEQLWTEIINSAPPKAANILAPYTKLVSLSENKATVLANVEEQNTLLKNKEKVEDLISRVLGRSVKVEFSFVQHTSLPKTKCLSDRF